MVALQFSSTWNSKADGRNLGCFTSILKFFDLPRNHSVTLECHLETNGERKQNENVLIEICLQKGYAEEEFCLQ